MTADDTEELLEALGRLTAAIERQNELLVAEQQSPTLDVVREFDGAEPARGES
jgi:hypothetical protein